MRVATIAIISDKNKNYLLTRRSSNLKTFPKCWVFPGGMVEDQGNLSAECLREVKEEVGIDVTLMKY